MKMARWLNALPLTLALVVFSIALSLATTACNNGGMAQVRVINAIPAAQAGLDVEFNGSKAITNLGYGDINPPAMTPAAYFAVNAGTATIEAFYTTQTVNPVLDNTDAILAGGDDYTILLGGYVTSPPSAYLISDDFRTPPAGTVKIRMINGSASSSNQYPGGFDIYMLTAGEKINGIPQVTGLTLGQAGPGYISLNFVTPYVVWVTPHNNTTPLLSATIPQSNSQVTTLVILDEPSGLGLSPNMLTLVDIQ
ncbi:MAG: DUF4397 domain-containing protein [Terriglobales bacterium]|jgi:hypothetical protein